jgi:hypothetical protein
MNNYFMYQFFQNENFYVGSDGGDYAICSSVLHLGGKEGIVKPINKCLAKVSTVLTNWKDFA